MKSYSNTPNFISDEIGINKGQSQKKMTKKQTKNFCSGTTGGVTGTMNKLPRRNKRVYIGCTPNKAHL